MRWLLGLKQRAMLAGPTCVGVEALLVEHFYQLVDARLRSVHFPVSADEKLALSGRHSAVSVSPNYQKSVHHKRPTDTATDPNQCHRPQPTAN